MSGEIRKSITSEDTFIPPNQNHRYPKSARGLLPDLTSLAAWCWLMLGNVYAVNLYAQSNRVLTKVRYYQNESSNKSYCEFKTVDI